MFCTYLRNYETHQGQSSPNQGSVASWIADSENRGGSKTVGEPPEAQDCQSCTDKIDSPGGVLIHIFGNMKTKDYQRDYCQRNVDKKDHSPQSRFGQETP